MDNVVRFKRPQMFPVGKGQDQAWNSSPPAHRHWRSKPSFHLYTLGGVALLAVFSAQHISGGASGFGPCGLATQQTCVIDGDTIRLNGQSIRLEDIDAPELFEPKCAAEQFRAQSAKNELIAVLNSGRVSVVQNTGRDEDRYGRKLRLVKVGGQSAGAALINKGLAVPRAGGRHEWCSS